MGVALYEYLFYIYANFYSLFTSSVEVFHIFDYFLHIASSTTLPMTTKTIKPPGKFTKRYMRPDEECSEIFNTGTILKFS